MPDLDALRAWMEDYVDSVLTRPGTFGGPLVCEGIIWTLCEMWVFSSGGQAEQVRDLFFRATKGPFPISTHEGWQDILRGIVNEVFTLGS